MLLQIFFWLLAVITGISTVMVVTVRNVVHAALALVGALLGASGIFLLFGAEFVGLTQVLIYVGAVVVLFLFGIMLTAAGTSTRTVDNSQRLLAAVVALAVFVVLAIGIVASFGDKRLELTKVFTTEEIGESLFRTWILPFEAVSMLLLAALIGAIVLARRD